MEWEEILRKEANKNAAKKVGELLINSNQLINIKTIKSQIIKQKIALEAQLKTVVQTQLDEGKETLNLLDHSNLLVKEIRNNFNSVNELCRDCQSLINPEHYKLIKQVDIVRNNLLTTLSEIDRLMRVPEKINKVKKDMEKNINILKVYMEVRAIERMREEAYIKAGGKSEEHKVLELAFRDVDELSNSFENKLFNLAFQCLKLASEEPAVLVKVLQIIEREEKCDELIRKKLKEKNLDPNDEVHAKKLKTYKDRLFQQLRDSIFDRFERVLANCITVDQTIPKLQQLIDDLTIVLDEVTPRFPPNYKIFEFFIKEYHIRFNTIVLVFVQESEKINAKQIIDLISWIKKQYNPQLFRLGITDLQPNLLESIEPLFQTYRNHIRKLMGNWLHEIINQDKDQKPDQHEGLYITMAPTLLFESINAQISIAKKTNDSKFIFEVMLECGSTLTTFQQNILKMLNESWQDLHLEYIISIVNNNYKSCDQLDVIIEEITSQLEEPYNQQLINIFETINNGFHDVAKKTTLILADIIFRDIKDEFTKLFEKEWYETKVIQTIIVTMEDYFRDIQGFIMESYFKKLGIECLERIIFLYVEQLFSKKRTFDKYTVEIMTQDENLLRDFFEKYIRKNFVDTSLQILTDLRELLDAEPDMISLYFHSLLKNNPDVTLNIIEVLLSMRSDLDKRSIKEALEGCSKILEQNKEMINNNTQKLGIFNRLQLPSKFPWKKK